MVSTLHITLSYNMPPSHAIGRSASCEDANRLGKFIASSHGGGFPAKSTSFSTSNVSEAKGFLGRPGPLSHSSKIPREYPGGIPERNSLSTSNVQSATAPEGLGTRLNSFSSSNIPSVTVPGGITRKTTSLSSSDLPLGTGGSRPLSSSNNFLLSPMPYSASSTSLRSSSWSPVRFNPTKPLSSQIRGTTVSATETKPSPVTQTTTTSGTTWSKTRGQNSTTALEKPWTKTTRQSRATPHSTVSSETPSWVKSREKQDSTAWLKSRGQTKLESSPVTKDTTQKTTQKATQKTTQKTTQFTTTTSIPTVGQPSIEALNWAKTRGQNKPRAPASGPTVCEAIKATRTTPGASKTDEDPKILATTQVATNIEVQRGRPEVRTTTRRGLVGSQPTPSTPESPSASSGGPPPQRTASSSRSPLRSPSRTPGTSPSSGGVPDWAFNSKPSATSLPPWRLEPKKLRPSSFSQIDDSVHSGRGSKGVVGGGVMEDGTSHAPVAARVVSSPASSAHRKAQSLPGHYNRPPPQSFRDAFTTSKSPTPPSASPGAPRHDAAQCMVPAAPPRGPTSPRATRVGSASAVIGHQYQQQQQQRHHLQQRLQQQEQHMQQQKFEQQKQQQRIQQEQIQQKMQEQHQERLQQQKQAQQKGGESAERQAPEKKSKRSLLSGIFRRRKKGAADSASSSSSTSSESEEPQQRRSFLRRRSKKKDHREREEPLPPPPPPPPAPEAYSPLSRGVGSVRVTPLDTGGTNSLGRETSYMVSSNGRRMVRVAPASLGGSSRGIDIQPLGIPTSLAQQGRRGVSASHDSLPVSLGSWGGSSHASLGYYSGVGMGARSSSTDTISKKERREALKARVERLREKFKDTSSEDEKASVSSHSMYGSESSLSKTNSLTKRTRNARTERYLRRKSQELETLRTETEKDRRNREVVQARIQEIQRVREYEAERNKINEEKKREAEKAHKPRWSAKLVYQESSEYESSVLLRTPSVSPAASPHMKAKFQGHIPQRPAETREAAVVMRNKPQTVTVALAPPSGVPLRRSFQDYEAPMQGDLGSHRSASYDSNINRSSFLMQSSSAGLPSSNRSGLTPPAPPPRDRSRIMSPADGRPMSFSFESLNQDPNRPNSSQSSLSNFTKGSSPSPSVRSVPAYLGPKPNGPQIGPPPLAVPNRRSFSELQLSPQQQSQLSYNTGGPPARPAPPGYPNTQYRYTDQPPRPAAAPNQYYRVQQQHIQPLQQQQHSQQHVQPQQDGSPNNNQLKYYTDMSPQYAKIVPISSVPPSPSSDYSSYMSDNSARLQQVNTAWRQKEKEIKNKKNVSQVMSDSSRSNSPRITEGNNTNNGLSSVEQGEETYGTILTKKPRPPPLSLKQAESLSSLSGQSDVSSPLPKGPDSDSSQSSLAKEKKKIAQNRPLSMVLEKSESAEKDSPPVTPKTRPQPPRRGHRQITTSDLSITKQQILHSIIKHKQEHPQDKPKYQKEFEEMYRKEKERLEKSKCANFEEALKELEEIYDSLRLDNDDILDRAERRDLPTAHQQLRDKDSQETLDSTSETTETDSTVKGRSSRPRTPKMRRSGVPDKKSDDMHFRRCQQSSRNQPDVQKALQMTGSYLLMSPAHTTPTDVDKNIPKDPMLEGEPDIVYDDVSYRNIKQANSIKIIDPQPPFGIPLGPTTQSSPSDYLHVSRKDNYRPKMIARKQPDTTMDDLAFRNLRKDQKDRELNMSELDELLSEANTDSPVHRRRGMRSMSADRVRGMQSDHNLNRAREHSEGPPVVKDKGGKLQTPRRVKHQQEARRAGRFFESYKDALTDGESGMTSPLGPRHNPSWLERANLVDNKWENLSTSNLSTLSTSTETLTEMSSARAVSQPDIRQAIIREARVPTGGPSAWKGTDSQSKEATFTPITSSIATISAPKLVKIQTIQSAPVSPIVVERKPYRPLDSIFNNKPKPFYLADPKPAEQQQKQDPVDIARLDALISTLSKIDTNDEATTPSTPPASSPLTSPLKETNVESVDKTPVVSNTDVSAKPDTVNKPDTSNPLKISEEPVYENVFEPQQSISDPAVPVEKICAKANIEKAIRLSMALESSNSEGEREDEVDLIKRHHTEKGSPVREKKRSEQGKQKEKRKSEGEKQEKEKKRETDRSKTKRRDSDKLKEREKRDKQQEYERLRIGEREKRKSLEKERKAANEEKRERKKSGEEKERKKSADREKRRSEDREKRKSEEREKRRSEEREKRRSEEREKRRSEEREKRKSEERLKRRSPEKNKQEEVKRKEKERSEEKECARLSVSPEKRLSSSSSSSGRMVQQSGSSGGVGGGSGAGSRGEQDDTDRAELERRERIQRYKDERRKQIAARYGTAEWSSSEESGTGEESSYRAYRRRRRGGRDNDSSTNDLSSSQDAKRPHENGSSLEGRGSSSRRGVLGSSSEDVIASSVRATRASRLRQSASTSPNNNNNNNEGGNNNNNNFNNNNNNLAGEGVGERGRGETPPDLPPVKRPPEQVDVGRPLVGGDSADSTLSGSDGRSGRARRSGSGGEKDKSNKRKSNLNRSTTDEATADAYSLAHPSDSNEDTPRRRRRRTPLSPVGGGLPSVTAAEPLKTPEVVRHVVSRLTPPPSPPTSSQPLSSPSSQPSPPPSRRHPSPQPPAAPPPHTFQPIQPAAPLGSPQGTQSAPSTLDTRHSRHVHQQLGLGVGVTAETASGRRVSGSSENEEGLSARKVPPKLAPLRKPDIPDVLRPKDNTSLASPGVVSTPPTSRPSSVVLDKPPLAPEGLRPAAFRSSLRKPSDTGTCFLAARREKRDEGAIGLSGVKGDIFPQKAKKGDRLSKSDMNLKIDSAASGRPADIPTPTATSDVEAGEASPPMTSPSITSSEVMSSRLEALTARARDAMDRADRLSEDAPVADSADTMVHECEQYLTTVTTSGRRESPSATRRRDHSSSVVEAASDRPQQSASSMTGVLSDTGQKNWVGGSEGRGKESKRMANEKEVKKKEKRESQAASGGERAPGAPAGPSGPPDHVTFMDDRVSPPPEEVALGLQHHQHHHHEDDDEDIGSDSSPLRSPEHRGSGRCRARRCSLDGDSRTNSPDPQSILKRRSSREDVMPERPTTPEPHSILKRKTSSRTSSLEVQEGEPRPILKKKSSAEELEHFEPRPILKKKSSTDDELDDRPRSILKGGRSREDLDRSEGVISPNPILKRSPRYDSEGEGELRPILKRRDTTDGVRLRLHVSDGEDVEGDAPSVRVRSDSAPESAIRMRGRSPPAPSATPAHGILKKRGAHSPARFDQMDSELGAILRSRRSLGPGEGEGDSPSNTPMRPLSPSLVALTNTGAAKTGERPLSVAERVAGMEAARQEPAPRPQRSPTPTRSPGARPKVNSAFLNNTRSPESERESRQNGAYSLVPEPAARGESAEAINEAFLDRPVVEAFNSAMTSSLNATPETPSSVSQRAAFFAQLEREQKKPVDTGSARSTRFGSRRERGTRHATQPVTEDEVTQAARMADASDSASASHDSDTAARRESPSGFRAAREAMLRNAGEVLQGLTPGASPRKRPGSRKTSFTEPEDENFSDGVRGILKRESSGGSRDGQRDSPRSILKHHHSSSTDSRRASFSESENHPRGILKSESPLPPPVGSPDHEAKLLRGVLKKDSSLEDSKEIKSILKPESESLDPDHSSDSSSDDVTLTTANTPQGLESDLADSIRDIDPVRHKEEQHKSDSFKSEHHRVDLAEALRQVEPIKAKDDLAEALRQIEPIRAKDRSREREDRAKEDAQITVTKEVTSSRKLSSSMMTTMVSTSASVGSQSSSTATNSSSSNSENELKVIKNEAVMRRRTAHSRRYDERRSMVELRSLEKEQLSLDDSKASASASSSRHQQLLSPEDGGGSDSSSSSSSSDSCDGALRPKGKVMDASQILSQSPIFRNKTSSLTSSSSTSSSSNSPSPSDNTAKGPPGVASSPGSSINDRLAALQRNGEEGWKSRVKNEGKDVNSNVTLRPKPAGGPRERPVSLMERMSALENSSQQWRGRVTQSDATKFTVAHKMASASASCVPLVVGGVTPSVTVTPDQQTTPIGSPTVERKKRSPSQKVFKSKTGGNIPSLLNKSSPLSTRKDFRRSISTPNDKDSKGEAVEGTSVAVPRADDEDFMAFFSKTSTSETLLSPEEALPNLGDADFDHISETASQLVVKRRSVRVTRRQASSRNPLKALAAREDIKSEYTEVKLGVGEKELKRMKVEELSKGSTLAVEALAGLASKENFSAVALKKVENTPVVREMAPYTSLMLFQVKGRRHAQTRLVEPKVLSINQGDDFILITPTEVFHYKGEFANVIERAKASEIAQYIIQKKDMGITSARNVVELDENSPSGRKAKFWKLLGGDEMSEGQVCGLPDEDEMVESSLVAANKIYEVQGDTLVPIPDSWGQMPKIEILQSDKVLVLDFGSELYIWAGKRACGEERRFGLALGRELWEEEYDYSECDINPITPMVSVSEAKLRGTRPEWGLCAKLTENVETIVFKEKFIDWPDLAQQSRIKEVKKDMDRHVAPVCELQPCDARIMLEELPPEPDLVLEMSHLGRGVEYYDEEERRLLNISTNDYKVWHVSEYGKVLMDEKARTHLHEGDTYVVRWYYLITATGRTLKGEPSKHNVTGRSRVAYFFWQGKDSSVSDKGVSALMTVELDEERGPHVRVSMGSEPPAFLNLFQGGLVIHQGRHDDREDACKWKLFMVRGEFENEGHLLEVEVNSSFLRSRGCLVLINTHTGIIHLWHGAKALRHTRKVASVTAQKLIETSENEMGWSSNVTKKVKEQYEGAESRDFWEGFGGLSAKNKHFSLLEDEHSYDWTPRVWHMVATHDSFQANEVICSYRATSVPNPLPVLQTDLYSVAQPALFVVDVGHRVWVWQGWWPDESDEGQDSNTTGSAVLRFNFARRAALETTLNYCKLKAKAQAKALAAKSYKKIEVEVEVVEPQLVVAGMEPLEFTNIFPMWIPRPDVAAIQEKEGRWSHGCQYQVSEILAQLSRTNYSLDELTSKPLPDGVDPLHLEVYLSNEEFSEALGMSRNDFYGLQSWKQTELKKKANLF